MIYAMDLEKKKFDFWYAVNNTEIVSAPSRLLETFGVTLLNYHVVAEVEDNPGKVRVREGRLEAHKPTIIMPDSFMNESLEGFGEEAKKYYEFLKEHKDSVRILQYGYTLKQESFSEQVITDSLQAVLDRVVAQVKTSNDKFSVVIKTVDNPWDVSLVKFFWMHVNASAPFNVQEFEKMRMREMQSSIAPAIHKEVEAAFVKAAADPSLIKELGRFLQEKGIFEQYQDRFFQLVRRG